MLDVAGTHQDLPAIDDPVEVGPLSARGEMRFPLCCDRLASAMSTLATSTWSRSPGERTGGASRKGRRGERSRGSHVLRRTPACEAAAMNT